METDRMLEELTAGMAGVKPSLSVLILAEIRFLREALAEVVGRDQTLSISGLFADLDPALAMALERQPDVVLLDAAFPEGTDVVGRLRNVAPGIQVIVLAVKETEENIIAWAEAGVAGYVPSTAALADVVALLADIIAGKQACAGHVAGGMLRWIGSAVRSGNPPADGPSVPILTARELQIVQLIGGGLSNKDIARRLNIGVATAKSHVHNLLGKLALQRRGQVALWARKHGGPHQKFLA